MVTHLAGMNVFSSRELHCVRSDLYSQPRMMPRHASTPSPGVDAHLCWKAYPGARTWSYAPNSSSPKIVTEARSNQSISCRLSQTKEGMTLPIQVTWTAPMPTRAGMKRKTIYVLADGAGSERAAPVLSSAGLTSCASLLPGWAGAFGPAAHGGERNRGSVARVSSHLHPVRDSTRVSTQMKRCAHLT
jgi:rhodanese-related sulfurtransferase